MRIQKLEGTDAFIVFDLDEAPCSIGITRVAPKILVDGATALARTNTYLFATFGQQIGGASAGINAKPDEAGAAIEAFVAEVGPLVEAGTFLPDAGKGLAETDLAPLRTHDPRAAELRDAAPALLAAGVSAAADVAAGGLDERAVAIDGIDGNTAAIVAALAARGARIVAISGAKGAAMSAGGFDTATLLSALGEHGPAVVEHLGGEVQSAGAIYSVEADVLLSGSKVGAIDHDVAGSVTAKVIVPTAPVPVSAKALAALARSGTIVLPDFITIAGPQFAAFAEAGASVESVVAEIEHNVRGVLDLVLDHEDGPVLGACYRAEEFLRTWQDVAPFGRPLA